MEPIKLEVDTTDACRAVDELAARIAILRALCTPTRHTAIGLCCLVLSLIHCNHSIWVDSWWAVVDALQVFGVVWVLTSRRGR